MDFLVDVFGVYGIAVGLCLLLDFVAGYRWFRFVILRVGLFRGSELVHCGAL